MEVREICLAFTLLFCISVSCDQFVYVHDSSAIRTKTFTADECPGIRNTTSKLNGKGPCYERSTCPKGLTDKLDPQSYIVSNCFCDSVCATFGDCCTDIAEEAKKIVTLELDTYSCMSADKIGRNNIEISNEAAYLIHKCPSWYGDENVKLRCEDGKTTREDLYGGWPVSDHRGLLFRNKFCAECNDIHDYKFWKIEIGCRESLAPGSQFNSHESVNNLVYDLIDNENCDIIFKSPGEDAISRPCKVITNHCPASWTDNTGCDIKNKCISSGNAYVYGAYPNPEKSAYTNFYCALCNTDKDISCADIPTISSVSMIIGGAYPLSFILDLNSGQSSVSGSGIGFIDGAAINETVSETKICEDAEVYDYNFEVCRPITCIDGYVIKAGICVAESGGHNPLFSIDTDCPRVSLNSSEFVILLNGSLYISQSGEMYGKDSYEMNTNRALVCTNFTQNYTRTHYYFASESKFSTTQTLVSVIGQIISIIGLSIQLFVYCLLPKLRNLAGKCLMSLSASLLVAQLVFLVSGNASSVYSACAILAVITHFAFLSSFAWMHVMAYDIWKTFSHTTRPSSVDSHAKKFTQYSLYSFGCPLAIITLSLIVNFTLDDESTIRPAYGETICWIRSRIGLAVFFAAPVAAIIACNIVFYVMTVVSIIKITKITSAVTQPKSEKKQFWLYVKLTSIMGLTWVFGFIAAVFDSSVLWYFFIVLNSLQGAFICVAFVFTRQVLKLLRERFSKVAYSSVRRQPPASSRDSKTRSTVISGHYSNTG